MRVLIADDNADAAATLGALLELSGYRVHIATDGMLALDMAARLQPDFAVLDIGMPGLTGHEVARRIRREDWGQTMVLIAVTGWGQEADKRTTIESGFDHHVTKPADASTILRLLRVP
jgi:CheY-like chemotaxis protein